MSKNYTESDIRPEEIRQRYWSLLEDEVRRYLDGNDTLRAEYSSFIACPLCNGQHTKSRFVKRGFSIVECNICGMVYVNPVLDDRKLKEFYNSEALKYMQEVILRTTYHARKQHIHIPRAEMLKKIVPKGRLLEIGCSVGYFLEAAREVGEWELFGVDLNSEAAEYVRANLGIDVFDGRVEELDAPEDSFDAIVSFEVVEHLSNPLALMKGAFRLLKTDGVFIVSTPNIEGFDFQVLGKYHRSYSPPGHLVYFTPDTLRDMLGRAGFRNIAIETPGELDVENVRNELIRSPELVVEMDKFMRNLLLNEGEKYDLARQRYQAYLRSNGFSSHMVAICIK